MAVRGELNSDGKISVTDYNISVEHVLGKTSLEPWKYKFDAANLDEEERHFRTKNKCYRLIKIKKLYSRKNRYFK